MNYFVDLFSPETATAFEQSKRDVSGFRISQKTYVENQKIGSGDKFICYVTRLQRFVGVLEIKGKSFIDDTPLFQKENDPFVLRFKVAPLVWLPLRKAIPIRQDTIWNNLSFTKGLAKDSNRWTFMVFSSPRLWPKADCKFLEKALLEQSEKLLDYPFSEEDEKKLKSPKIRLSGKKEVAVSIPDEEVSEGHELRVRSLSLTFRRFWRIEEAKSLSACTSPPPFRALATSSITRFTRRQFQCPIKNFYN